MYVIKIAIAFLIGVGMAIPMSKLCNSIINRINKT